MDHDDYETRRLALQLAATAEQVSGEGCTADVLERAERYRAFLAGEEES